MQEELFNFISATFGVSAAVAFSIIMLALWLTYYITKNMVSVSKDHSVLEESVKKTEQNIDEIRKDLAFLKGNIEIFRSTGAALMQSHSPLSLTEEGRKVAEQMGASDIIDRNWGKIDSDIKASGRKNAYDIQEYCIETASVMPERFFDAGTVFHVKDFAYNNGNTVQLYLRVLGLMIRDRYLKENNIA